MRKKEAIKRVKKLTNSYEGNHIIAQNEAELLEVFQNFNVREQIKIIGKIEEWLEVNRRRQAITQQQIVGIQVVRRTDGKAVKIPVTAKELEKMNSFPEETDY